MARRAGDKGGKTQEANVKEKPRYTNDILEDILREMTAMKREQTALIKLWMNQDKNYHERTLDKIGGDDNAVQR